MPKVFKFNINDEVEIAESQGVMKSYIGKKGAISEQLEVSQYDYKVKFDNGADIKFKESELRKLNEYEPQLGDIVRIISTGETGFVETIDHENKQVEVCFGGYWYVFSWDIVELVEKEVEELIKSKTGYFQELGHQVGQLVDKKQLAYGDSVSKTYKLMQIFLEQYDNGDNTYTIPKSLLKHILLQVRMIDKQNRIFSNPDGDLMSENPYGDTVGYGLLGMRMSEEK